MPTTVNDFILGKIWMTTRVENFDKRNGVYFNPPKRDEEWNGLPTKVALIQGKIFFTEEDIQKYLNDIPILLSANVEEIYEFIKTNYYTSKIYKFILHINSKTLSDFIDYIHNVKQNSFEDNKLLSNCIFIATYSNADSVRTKNIDLNTNIYFNLSPISKLINTYSTLPPNRLMLVVSDEITPYYEQIYNTNVIPKYKISELTTELINNFANTGSNITLALDNDNEFDSFNSKFLASNFTRQLTYIELFDKSYILPALVDKTSSIISFASGTSLLADINYYPEINFYENSVIMLVKLCEIWEKMISIKLITQEPANHEVFIEYAVGENI
jgi:hypothetical protein